MDEGILRVLIVSLGMTLVAIVVLVIGSLIRRGKEPGMGVELAFITLIGILVFLWLDRGVGFGWRPFLLRDLGAPRHSCERFRGDKNSAMIIERSLGVEGRLTGDVFD